MQHKSIISVCAAVVRMQMKNKGQKSSKQVGQWFLELSIPDADN